MFDLRSTGQRLVDDRQRHGGPILAMIVGAFFCHIISLHAGPNGTNWRPIAPLNRRLDRLGLYSQTNPISRSVDSRAPNAHFDDGT
jgi:hypothetical protein